MKLTLLWVLWSVFSGTECVRRKGTRHRRSETCPEGLYTTEGGMECCLCPKGQYLERDCLSPGTSAQCLDCEVGTYLDHMNSERKCERCRTCSSSENMEKESSCSISSNTVCRCMDGHYCNKGDQCKVCYQCSTCEGLEVEAPCTPTNDTLCKQTKDLSPVIIVLIVLLVLAALIIFGLVLKRFCFKSSETPESPKVRFQPVEDLDLEPFLPKIAEILGFKLVQKVVKRQGYPQSKIDNIMVENPRDASEQAHQLLLAWYEKHGMNGAYRTLMENLLDINMKVKADKVEKLIQDGGHNRKTEQNRNLQI